jgi:hypothetical protein
MSDRKPPEDRKPPGLPSVHQLREDRGRGRYSRASGNLFLVAGVCLVAILLGYRFFSGRQLDEAKVALLSKQRAVASTLGTGWFPLRDRVEKLTTEAAAHFDGDHIEADAAKWDFHSLPGLYLRVRVDDARDVATLRRTAGGSRRDGFVACLLREPNVAATRGEADAGAFAEQPWNWKKAYAATRILTDEWVGEVKDAPDPLRLRVFEQQYDKAVREEIPLAIDLLQRAQFFLLVLDEATPEAASEAGAAPSDEALQEVGHFARVHLLDLKSGKEVLRVRRSAEASFLFAGESPVTDPETLTAMKRQVNNCALAKAVQAALTPGGGG